MSGERETRRHLSLMLLIPEARRAERLPYLALYYAIKGDVVRSERIRGLLRARHRRPGKAYPSREEVQVP